MQMMYDMYNAGTYTMYDMMYNMDSEDMYHMYQMYKYGPKDLI